MSTLTTEEGHMNDTAIAVIEQAEQVAAQFDECPMSKAEATEWVARVGSTVETLRVLLFEGYRRHVWETLGFPSWTQCLRSIAEECGYQERHLWRLHEANITENLLTDRTVVGRIPEWQLRPLTALEEQARPIVWQKVIDAAAEKAVKVTAALVKEEVERWLFGPDSEPVTFEDDDGDAGEDETFEAARLRRHSLGLEEGEDVTYSLLYLTRTQNRVNAFRREREKCLATSSKALQAKTDLERHEDKMRRAVEAGDATAGVLLERTRADLILARETLANATADLGSVSEKLETAEEVWRFAYDGAIYSGNQYFKAHPEAEALVSDDD